MAHLASGYAAVPAADDNDDGGASNPAAPAALAADSLPTAGDGDDDDVELQSSRTGLLAAGAADPSSSPAAPAKHKLTLTNSLALILGLQIGSGIFAAPAQVSAHALSSPLVGLSVWLLGGALVWTGAASLAELGLALPDRNGGVMEYLRLGWGAQGDLAAMTFAWAWAAVVKPCALALTAIVFAENAVRGVAPEALADRAVVKSVAVLGLSAVLAVNCRGARTGARVGDVFMWMKVVIIVSIPCLGVVSLWTVKEPPARVSPVVPDLGDPWTFVGEYTTALFGALFCYGGWETANYVAGDMKNPQRDLPRAIHTAMIIVILGFTALVSTLYLVMGFAAVAATSTPIVDFADLVLGPLGRRLFALAAAVCALGSMHANVFALGSICVTAAERSYLPRKLAWTDATVKDGDAPRGSGFRARFDDLATGVAGVLTARFLCLPKVRGVPIYSILFSAVPSFIFLIIGTFNGLVTFYGIAEFLFYFLSVLGIFSIRKEYKIPQQQRTYTFNPVVFCLLSFFICARGILTEPLQGVAIAAAFLVSFLYYRTVYLPSVAT